jgi:xylulose-5-phosphate/fructose-6-phosphate phosphoketolase
MPGQQIDRPNPPPLESQLPEAVLALAGRPETKPLPDHLRQALQSFQRAACYIAACE